MHVAFAQSCRRDPQETSFVLQRHRAHRYQEIIDDAVRCPDPFVRLRKRWIVRRLAPDCSRVELASLPKERDEFHLLQAMGWETANIHLGTAKARVLLGDLAKRPSDWLWKAANKMEKAVQEDFKEFAKGQVPEAVSYDYELS